MSNKHKSAYIAEHGQENWNLFMEYKHHGNRSTEATNANRLYKHFSNGSNSETFTIYTISEGNTIIYVGRTGGTLATRWINHKSAARLSKDTQPLHIAMMTTTDTDTFPEWTAQTYVTTTDKDVAIQLEKMAIVALGTNINGYNRRIGGGNANKKFMKDSQ